MTRPLRLQFAGALYHVTARGNRKEDIFRADADRYAWIAILGEACARFNFVVHGYCQMTNHYHLLLETVQGNLSQGMRHLNGVYSQYFNRQYGLVGHIFQGRYKAILVQKDLYLLELTRYVVLNPLRAQIVSSLDEWHWSSHHLVVGDAASPDWLDTEWLLAQFAGNRAEALPLYRKFVMAGMGLESPLASTSHQTILGTSAFVQQFQHSLPAAELRGISKTQRRTIALPLDGYQAAYPDRNEAMARAYFSTAYSMSEIGRHFGVSQKTVSRAVKSWADTNLATAK